MGRRGQMRREPEGSTRRARWPQAWDLETLAPTSTNEVQASTF